MRASHAVIAALAILVSTALSAADLRRFDFGLPVPVEFAGTLCEANGRLYCVTRDPLLGTRVRATDGTAIGTTIASVDHGSNANMFGHRLAALGFVFYWVQDPTGGALWRTDGTETGCVQLFRVNGEFVHAGWLVELNGLVYFGGAAGSLYRTDGTTAGTVQIAQQGWNAFRPIRYKGKLYADLDGSNGRELYVSDGTVQGTVELTDLNPAGGSNPALLGVYNDELYFSADDGLHGNELWKTDGSAAGTVMVADLNPGPGSTVMTEPPVVVNGLAFFFVQHNAGGELGYPVTLWRTDGTTAGTIKLTDYTVAQPSLYDVRSEHDGFLYFGVRSTTSQKGELWKTDGTIQNTSPVWVAPNAVSTVQTPFVCNGTVFFLAVQAEWELWKLDESGVASQAATFGNVYYAYFVGTSDSRALFTVQPYDNGPYCLILGGTAPSGGSDEETGCSTTSPAPLVPIAALCLVASALYRRYRSRCSV